MKLTGELDRLDEELIDALMENARMPVADLARRLHVARTTVHDRLERLERRGVVAGYTIRLSQEAQGRRITAHVQITVDPKQSEAIVAALHALPEVRRLETVSGAYDLVAVVAALTTAAVDDVLDRIGRIGGIERTTSAIVLSTKFDR